MRLTAEADHLAFVDVETTGFSTDYDRIIQICIMSGPQSFVTYVNPKRELDSRAMAVNGITEADVRLAPPFEAISRTIYELLAGKIIVGHNVCFDLRFIASELKASALTVSPFEYICTMSLEKMLFGAGQGSGFYTLPACLERIGVVNDKAHDALHDVLATKRLFEHQLARIGSDQEMIRRYPSEQRQQRREAAPKVYTSLRGFAGWGTQSDAMTIERFNRFMERALDDGTFSEKEVAELASLRIEKAAAQAELSKAVVDVFRECIDDGVITLDEYEFIEKSKSVLGLNSKQLYPVFKQLMPTLQFTCFDMMPWMNADGTFFEQEEESDIGLVTGHLLNQREVFRYALYKGYYPTLNVTKETDLCVNGHSDLRSHTQTRTADKYGIPVVRFAAFAAELGMPVKSFVVRIPTPAAEHAE